MENYLSGSTTHSLAPDESKQSFLDFEYWQIRCEVDSCGLEELASLIVQYCLDYQKLYGDRPPPFEIG